MRRKLPFVLLFAAFILIGLASWYAYHWFRPSPAVPLGINTNEVSYADSSVPFVDLFRLANPFQENILRLNSTAVEYDADGWPKNLHGGEVGTRFVGEFPAAALPEGDYTVLYDGEGEIRYGNDVKLVRREAGRDIIRLAAGQNGRIDTSLIITQSNPANYLRNIRILPPGGICADDPFRWVADASACPKGMYRDFVTHHADILFHPDYLAFLRDFQVIRFMPMSGITRNPIRHWEQRPKLMAATWGGNYGSRGVPLEIMVELANRLRKDVWFNIPHAADDTYVREFATYVRQHLHPTAKVYLEYSNEVWNTVFDHGEYLRQQGVARGLHVDVEEAGLRYYVQRAQEVFAIWGKAFGGTERLVRVLGSWDMQPDYSRRLLALNHAYRGVDALAIAPYFGVALPELHAAQSVDEVFALLQAADRHRSVPSILQKVREHAAIARAFGVRLLAYEAGQGLVDWDTRRADEHPNPLIFAANRDPRMGELYRQLLEGWFAAGGDLLVLFAAPRPCHWYGCWGLKEHGRQPAAEAPKYQAVLAALPHLPLPVPPPPKPAEVPLPEPVRNSATPLIAWRPAQTGREFVLENPNNLHKLLQGQAWDRQGLSARWQGKWDKDALYLTVQVVDDHVEAGDAVHFLLDADNSRGAQLDGARDFHLSLGHDCALAVAGNGAPLVGGLSALVCQTERTRDGYKLQVRLPWAAFGLQPDIRHKASVNVAVADVDHGTQTALLAWQGRDRHALQQPEQWGGVLFSGR